MLSGVIYLYSFILSSIGSFFDFLLPFSVPTPILSITDFINSFWLYGLDHIPITTITIAKFFSFTFMFYVVFKIVLFMRLPFTWLENLTHTSSHRPSTDISPSSSNQSKT